MSLKAGFFLVLRLALAGVFMVSGYQKLVSPTANFAEAIERFELVKGPIAWAAAWTLPWAEFVGGVFLALGLWTRIAMALLWAMNAVFIVLLSSSLVRKLPLDQCGCFGEAVTLTVPQMLALDACLFFAFALSWRFHDASGAPTVDQHLTRA